MLEVPVENTKLLGASLNYEMTDKEKGFFHSLNVSNPKSLIQIPANSIVENSYDYPLPHNVSYVSNRKSNKQNYGLGLTFAFISSMCYASNIVLGKYAITRNDMLTPYDINFMRAVVSLIVNSYIARKENATLLSCTPKAFWLMIICNMAALVRSYATVWSYHFISGSKCILIINTSPVIIVILGGMLLGERVTRTNYFIAVLALLG